MSPAAAAVQELELAWPSATIEPEDDGGYALADAPFDLQLRGALDNTRIAAHQNGDLSFEVVVEDGILSVALPQDDGTIRYSAEVADEHSLRILFDRGIVEILAANGAICGTRRSYANIAPEKLEVISNASATLVQRCRRAT